ncbi:hypothetical protein HQ447_07140 [bacterium]|nr:hypothetical protein [bacterium]
MNTIPNSILLSDRLPVAPAAQSDSKTSATAAEEAFFHCMSWVADYDQEWTAFVEAHALRKRKSVKEEDNESLPRVWNTPHS